MSSDRGERPWGRTFWADQVTSVTRGTDVGTTGSVPVVSWISCFVKQFVGKYVRFILTYKQLRCIMTYIRTDVFDALFE